MYLCLAFLFCIVFSSLRVCLWQLLLICEARDEVLLHYSLRIIPIPNLACYRIKPYNSG